MRTAAASRVLVLLVVFVLSVFALGQSSEPASSSIPTFTSHSDLVMVPVVVAGKNGGHITGLKGSDFTVLEDGKPVKVAVFEEVVSSTKYTKPQPQAQERGVFSNAQENRTPRPLVILALDSINTPLQDRFYAREQLAKYLEGALDDNAMVALVVMTRSGVHIIHDFTTNPAVLAAALKHASAATTPGAADTMITDEQASLMHEISDLENLDRLSGGFAIAAEMRISVLATMECLTQIAQTYGGVPGRKALVWVTAGFPFTLNDSAELTTRNPNLTADGLSTVHDDYEHAWQVLNDANFALYTVDARGLVNPAYISAEVGMRGQGNLGAQVRQRVDRQVAVNRDRLDTFRAFAEMTGGQAFVNNNDLTRGFRAAVEDQSAYYLLGFYRDTSSKKPGWHKLKVKLSNGVEVRARSGYLVAREVPAKSEDEVRRRDIRLALYSPMQFTALPLSMRIAPAKAPEAPPEGKKFLGFQVQVPTSALETRGKQEVSLSIAGVVRDRSGRDVADLDKTFTGKLTGGLNSLAIGDLFAVPPGQYNARIVVRDNVSGHTGSIIAPVTVQ